MKSVKSKQAKKLSLNDKDHKVKKGPTETSVPRPSNQAPKGRRPEAIQAGVAAMARNTGNPVLRILSSREILERDQRKARESLAVDGVYFRCPQIGPEVLSKDQWKEKIHKHLRSQLKKDKIITPCLMIKTLNGLEVAEKCVNALTKYIENIMNNPEELKYRQIRVKNKFFQENVYNAAGALEFLESAGFTEKKIPTSDGQDNYFTMEGDVDIDHLGLLIDTLRNASPIRIEVDRNVQVLKIEQALQRFNIPDDFFRLKPHEIKKEQELRTKAVEDAETLKTKAMRETEQKKLARTYNFTVVRVRFPDAQILQGTFGSLEKFSEVRKLVEESMSTAMEYSLRTPLGHRLENNDDEKTLAELSLVPTSLLTFACEEIRPVKKGFLRADLPRVKE